MVANEAFDALADPVRREILAVLAERSECNAGELANQIDRVGRTAVSSHLRVLRTSGLITEQKRGRFRFYAIDPDGATRDVIQLLQGLLQGSLDEAKLAAETRSEAPRSEGSRDEGARRAPDAMTGT